jgi:hypothetical protein
MKQSSHSKELRTTRLRPARHLYPVWLVLTMSHVEMRHSRVSESTTSLQGKTKESGVGRPQFNEVLDFGGVIRPAD